MTNEIIHLEAGMKLACSSFRRGNGNIGYSLMDYNAALNGTFSTDCRACKTCYSHYVRRMNIVNRKRAETGKAPRAILPLA